MLIGARTAAWGGGGVDSEYFCEYVECDGSTKVITDLNANASDVHELKITGFQYGNTGDVFGYYDWSAANLVLRASWDNSKRNGHVSLRAGYSSVGIKDYGSVEEFTDTVLMNPSLGLFIGGVKYGEPYSPSTREANPYCIFGSNISNYGSKFRVHYLKTWRNGELIRHWKAFFDGVNAGFKDVITGSKVYGLIPSGLKAGPKL